MSTCISMGKADFFIADKDKDAAYKAAKAEYQKESWFQDVRCIEELLEEFAYCPENDGRDNIIGLEFTGEKLGSEKNMFNIIAPFVKNGSFIEMHDEYGGLWRWVFDNGKCTEVTPNIKWD